MSENLFKVALVDDDEDDRFNFMEAFGMLKIKTELLLFNDGQEFIDYVDVDSNIMPELIFLDLNMPRKNGIDCLKYLRKRKNGNELFIAIYSTSSAIKDMDMTFTNGANIYIQKPTNFDILTKVIDRTLKTCYQYKTSHLSRENFLLKLP